MLALKRLYWKWLYHKIDSKVIYEVVKDKKDPKMVWLYGPVLKDTIRLASPKYKEKTSYEYVQVINGQIQAAFKKNELIFLDQEL